MEYAKEPTLKTLFLVVYFGQIHLNSTLRYNMSQKLYLFQPKLTFWELCVQLSSFQNLQHHSQMFFMLFWVFGINQNIIYENYNKFIQKSNFKYKLYITSPSYPPSYKHRKRKGPLLEQ